MHLLIIFPTMKAAAMTNVKEAGRGGFSGSTPGKRGLFGAGALLFLLSGCGSHVRLADVQRIDAGSIPLSRTLSPAADAQRLAATDLVEFRPKNGEFGALITLQAGGCTDHPDLNQCKTFLTKHAAFSGEQMASGLKPVVPVAALACVSSFKVTVATSGGTSTSSPVFPTLAGPDESCPIFSRDMWLTPKELASLLKTAQGAGSTPASDLVDFRIIRPASAQLLPGDSVTLTQDFRLGKGNGDPIPRPSLTSQVQTRVDAHGYISAPSPGVGPAQPCDTAEARCAQQRAIYPAARASAFALRLWKPDVCQRDMARVSDAEVCLAGGWLPEQLRKLPGAMAQKIRDTCVGVLDIDLLQRRANEAADWEGFNLQIASAQHWKLVGHDGAVFEMPWQDDQSVGVALEQAYRNHYGQPLVTSWLGSTAHVVIVPSAYRCQAERGALWIAHSPNDPQPSALGLTKLLPGDTVYVNRNAPRAD